MAAVSEHGRVAPIIIAVFVLAALVMACAPEVQPGDTAQAAQSNAPPSNAPPSVSAAGNTFAPASSAPASMANTADDRRFASTATPTTSTTSTTSTTTSTATSTTRVPAMRTVSFAFTGDTLMHSPLWRQAERNAQAAGRAGHDFTPMLAPLRNTLESVDLAVCHLETPIAPLGEPLSTFPLFGVPVEVIDALAEVGYDRCSTASNHTIDRGNAGIDRTVDALVERGLTQAGMARYPAEIEPTIIDVAGVATSHLSYTWSYNGLRLPDEHAWRSALIEPDRIVADVATARALGAEIVIVSLHWGAEGVHEPTGYQRDIARELTDRADIDLVIGHHAHVVQPVEQVNGTWVLFGLGNIISNLPTSDRWPAASRDGVVITVSMRVDPDGRVAVDRPVARPTWVDHDAGWVVVDVLDALANDDLSDGHRGILERSFDRTAKHLGDAPIHSSPA